MRLLRAACCWAVAQAQDDTCTADGTCALPDGWAELKDVNGQTFYNHKDTGTSQWKRPTGPLVTGKMSMQMMTDAMLAAEAQGNTSVEGFPSEDTRVLRSMFKLLETPQRELPTPGEMKWKVLSSGIGEETPRIYIHDDFLSAEECAYMRSMVTGRLEDAHVVAKSEDKFSSDTAIRNNKQLWLTQKEERDTPFLRHVLKRMHRSAMVPDDDAEAIQVGHYLSGTKYEMHQDSAPEHDVGRPATMIVYLADVEEGGYTIFPINKDNNRKCSTGWHGDVYGIKNCCDPNAPGGETAGMVRVTPKRGRAVLFFNHKLNGKQDMLAQHAACPPTKGEKWIIQRWFRFSPHISVVHPRDVRFDGLPLPKPENLSTDVWGGRFDARVLNQKGPSIYYYDTLLDAEELAYMRALATELGVTADAGAVVRKTLPAESEIKDGTIMGLVKRIYRVARVPEGHAEQFEFIALGPGASLEAALDTGAEMQPKSMMLFLDDSPSGVFFPMGLCASVAECCGDVPALPQEFEFALEEGQKLGLKVAPGANDETLYVVGLTDGAVMEWNQLHPGKTLSAGASITAVNGVTGDVVTLKNALRGAKGTMRITATQKQPKKKNAKQRSPILVPAKAGSAVLVNTFTVQGKGPQPLAAYGSCPAGSQGRLMLKRSFVDRRKLEVQYARDPAHDIELPADGII